MSTQTTCKGALTRLMSEYKALREEKWVNIAIDEEQMLRWTMTLIPFNEKSLYHGGHFRVEMEFPPDYPYSPPDFRFLDPLFHPNIHPTGRVCISILHPAQRVEGYKHPSDLERWNPLQGVESLLRSILLLLDEPEASSAANGEAGALYHKDLGAYRTRVLKDVEASKKKSPAQSGDVEASEKEISPRLELPLFRDAEKPSNPGLEDDFWNEGTGSSDSGSDMSFFDDDDDEVAEEGEEKEEEEKEEQGEEK